LHGVHLLPMTLSPAVCDAERSGSGAHDSKRSAAVVGRLQPVVGHHCVAATGSSLYTRPIEAATFKSPRRNASRT
jgi:hypothetical protein